MIKIASTPLEFVSALQTPSQYIVLHVKRSGRVIAWPNTGANYFIAFKPYIASRMHTVVSIAIIEPPHYHLRPLKQRHYKPPGLQKLIHEISHMYTHEKGCTICGFRDRCKSRLRKILSAYPKAVSCRLNNTTAAANIWGMYDTVFAHEASDALALKSFKNRS